ncbi:MAG: hypothetical protein C4522_17370 [Desulfobacteraceae bacterium]|nr:MAG: hypothetical protein C4522_17370 [Desulfobacteraceae bacterium]
MTIIPVFSDVSVYYLVMNMPEPDCVSIYLLYNILYFIIFIRKDLFEEKTAMERQKSRRKRSFKTNRFGPE